jgi:hypothetical protein
VSDHNDGALHGLCDWLGSGISGVERNIRSEDLSEPASAGLTVEVGAAANLRSKIMSPGTMMVEERGPTISRAGRIVPEVKKELIGGQNTIRAQALGYLR